MHNRGKELKKRKKDHYVYGYEVLLVHPCI